MGISLWLVWIMIGLFIVLWICDRVWFIVGGLRCMWCVVLIMLFFLRRMLRVIRRFILGRCMKWKYKYF